MKLCRPWNRHDPGFLSQKPGQCDLGGRRVLALSDAAEQIDERPVRLAGIGREPRDGVAEVGAVESGVLVDLTGEVPLAQRAEGNEADSELFEYRDDLRLGFPPPKRVLALEGRYGLDRVRTTDGLDARFREAKVPDLALSDQLLHRPGDVFDGHVRVDAVLVEQVDGVNLEPPQRCFGDLFDVLG